MKYIYDKKLQNIKVRFDVVEVYLDEKKIVQNKDAFILSWGRICMQK